MGGADLCRNMLNELIAEYGPRSETEHLLVQRLANLFGRERGLVQTEQREITKNERMHWQSTPVNHFPRHLRSSS